MRITPGVIAVSIFRFSLPAAATTEKLAVEPAIASMYNFCTYYMDMLCCDLSPCQLAELNRQQSCQLTFTS